MSDSPFLEQLLASAEKIRVTYDVKKTVIHGAIILQLSLHTFSQKETGIHRCFFFTHTLFHVVSFFALNLHASFPIHYLHIHFFWPLFYSSFVHSFTLFTSCLFVMYLQRTSFMISHTYTPMSFLHHCIWWIYMHYSFQIPLKILLFKFMVLKLWISLCTFQVSGILHGKGTLAKQGCYIFWKEQRWGKHMEEPHWKCGQLI